MKKLYSLFILTIFGSAAFAQTVNVNATGAAGSYKTGYIRNFTTAAPTRNDGNMQVKFLAAATTPTAANAVRRGWAVFNLAGAVPAGATVTAVSIRFTKATVATTGNPAVAINGYAGDYSTIASGSTIYTNIGSATAFNTTAWGGTTGTITRPFNAAGISFINTAALAGGIVSIGFMATGTPVGQIFTITGEGGTTATQPQLQITYACASGITGVTAGVSPTPVCVGSTFSLSGTATGAGSYQWTGPGGYTSTDLNPAAITATAASAGVYTLAAYYTTAGSCSVTATSTLAVNPLPSAITGNLSPCAGAATTLGSTPTTGTWSINSTSGATIAGSVVSAGSATGATTVTYTLPTGCKRSVAITTLDTPSAINPPAVLCVGSPVTLTSTPTGGAWLAAPASVATIGSTSGIISGVGAGVASITYTGTNGCKTTATTQVVVPPAAAITSSSGSFHICPSLSITLSNAVPGATWSTAPGGSATVNSVTGVVTGISLGSAVITYANTCGSTTATVLVDPPPPPITGVFSTCENTSVTLHNAATGGIWSGSNNSIALAAAGFGTVTGVSEGTLTITYTDVSGCVATTPFTVNPIPAAITGPVSTCAGTSVILANDSLGGVWSSADTFTAKINATSGNLTGRNPNNTTIFYTFPATGCQVSRLFTVNPLPVAITGNASFCNGKSDSLHNLSLGGTWSSNNTSIATIGLTSGLVTGVNGGTTTITYTLPTGCIRTRPITIRPLPNAVISYDFFTETMSTYNYFTSYQWYENGVAIPGANSNSCAALDAANYSVYVTDTFGCEKMSNIFNVSAVGVNHIDLQSVIKVQPNPTTGYINISSPVAVMAIITSLEGKVVMQQANAKEMDMSSLTSGMYMIMLYDQSGNRVAVQKVIKQ